MERLTMRNHDGSVSQPTRTTVEDVFYRLAAYEDTGMEPKEVQIVAEMFAGDPYVPILKVSDLVKAYREGRVEILPPNNPLTLEDLRQSYDYLKATFDILRDENTSMLKQVKEIEAAYEAANAAGWYGWKDEVKQFDRLLAVLPTRAWVE